MELYKTVENGLEQIQSTSKLINTMVRHNAIQGEVSVFPNDINKEKATIMTQLLFAENKDIVLEHGGQLTFDAVDKMIFDAVLTLIIRDKQMFTVQDVIRVYSGSDAKCFSATRLNDIYNRIYHMCRTMVMINCDKEFNARGINKPSKVKSVKMGDYLLPVLPVEIEMKNGTIAKGFRVVENAQNSPLVSYIFAVNQLAVIPEYCYGAVNVRDTDEFDAIQMYILQSIADMKHNKGREKVIRLDAYNGENGKHGLYQYVDINKCDYSEKGWYKKQRHVIEIITDILQHQKSVKYIKNYKLVCLNGSKVPYKVEVIF